jgi:hypothetical protein
MDEVVFGNCYAPPGPKAKQTVQSCSGGQAWSWHEGEIKSRPCGKQPNGLQKSLGADHFLLGGLLITEAK